MRTVLQIFTRDLRRIIRNPVALVVTLGVAIIPSLYAWCNILANWDPYSATGNLKVAVANEDRGATSDLIGDLDAGAQVVDELKQNHDLGWTFVGEDQALEGVRSGEYYAAIVLPEDFSERLVSLASGDATRPGITYYVNEKNNAIAPKITDTGATTIDEQINSTFVATVADAVASAVSDAGDTLSDATDRTRDGVVADLADIDAKLAAVREALADLQATMDDSSTTIAAAKQTVADLTTQVASARTANTSAATLLTQVQQDAGTFSAALSGALDDGAIRLTGVSVNVADTAGTILSTFNAAQDSVESIAGSLDAPLASTATMVADLRDALERAGIDTGSGAGQQLWAQLDALDAAVADQRQQISTFRTNASQFITDGKTATSGLAGATGTAASGGIATLNAARSSLNGTIMPSLTSGLNGFATLSGTLSGSLSALSSTLDQSDALFDQLADTVSQTSSTIAATDASLADLRADVATVRTDVAALGSSATYQAILDAMNLDGKGLGEFMGNPVALTTKVVYPTDNYGSAVTPFYTNLALWVGGFVLVAIYKLEVDREGLKRLTATQAYFGRWMLMMAVALLQALVATLGDLALGIQCVDPLRFVAAGLVISFVYVNIIYALAVAFRHIGKAVAVVLVIVQIPGASGLYPIEMMPDFFRNLYPWLPFTYGINAMRETVAGEYGSAYWSDMLHLLAYLPVALFIGVFVRRYAVNLNALFDRRLGDTDLMLTEHGSMVNERVSFGAALRSLPDSDELRAVIRHRAHVFFGRYPKLVRGGLVLLLVLPLVFLTLLFVIPAKLAMLTAWIVSIVVIDVFLIVVEYTRETYARQLGLSAMSADEFRSAVLRGVTVPLPFARHEARHEVRHEVPREPPRESPQETQRETRPEPQREPQPEPQPEPQQEEAR